MKWLLTILASVAAFFLNRAPGRKETLRNKVEDLKRKIYELQNKKSSWTDADHARYDRLSDELRKVEQRIKNS